MKRAAIVLAVLAAALPAARALAAPAASRAPVASTRLFAFFDDFDANLHDALMAAGLARKRGKAELFHSGAEAACFGRLPASSRAAWDRAVDYDAEIVSPGGFGDPPQLLVRMQLAGFDDELKSADDRQFVEIARSFRGAAAPAYRACRWPEQDRENRRWIDAVRLELDAHEEPIAPRLERLYGKRWQTLPIPVDVVETVDWSGANTIVREPAGGHILVSRENPESAGLEVVFHEASHILMRGGDPVRQALAAAARSAGFRLPNDAWHVVLFFTTGEVVRDTLDAGAASRYEPMLDAIFGRGAWPGYRRPLEKAWRPYVKGDRTLADAAAALVDELRRSGEPLR